MRVDIDLVGAEALQDRLDHASDGILTLARDLEPLLLQATPPTVVFDSVRMRPRQWGSGDVWTLPAGGWLAPRVKLPDDLDTLTDHVQELLDG